ncbi:MAG: hypothetical protein Q9173_002150 [Seirophora scorigena]
MSSSHGHSSSRHASHSSSASRHPAPSKRSTAHRGMDTVPEHDVLPGGSRAPDDRSTRLSGAEGQQLMIRGHKQQSTHPSRASEYEDGDVRGFSRKEVSYGAGGVKHRSEGGRGESSSSRSRTQGPYNDEPSRRRDQDSYASSRVKTIYEDDEKTITRDDNNSRRTMVPYESARTATRDTHDEKTITRDDNNSRRTMVPYESARTVTRDTRPSAPPYYGQSSSRTITRDNSRAVGPRVQTIRDSSSSSRAPSASSTTSDLKQRLERLEDEKTRRLERQVEKLGDQVAQMQMGHSAAPAVYVPAPGYCACEYCCYGAGYRCHNMY